MGPRGLDGPARSFSLEVKGRQPFTFHLCLLSTTLRQAGALLVQLMLVTSHQLHSMLDCGKAITVSFQNKRRLHPPRAKINRSKPLAMTME